MRQLILLGCTAAKRRDPHLLPALERYDGPSFRCLRRQRPPDCDVLIASAYYGLIAGTAPIPWYDQRLAPARAAELRAQVRDQWATWTARHGPYSATIVHLSQDYRALWVDPADPTLPIPLAALETTLIRSAATQLGMLTLTSGGLFRSLAQLRAWLHQH